MLGLAQHFGVERYRLKLDVVSESLRNAPDGMNRALVRGIRERVEKANLYQKFAELNDAMERVPATTESRDGQLVELVLDDGRMAWMEKGNHDLSSCFTV